MAVRRLVANLAVDDPAALAAFYRQVFELDLLMDHGWILTLGGEGRAHAQFSLGSEGGGGAPVPALSVEVDDLEAVLQRAREAGAAILFGPRDEPWGVRRFFLRDPAGHIVNVLVHLDADA